MNQLTKDTLLTETLLGALWFVVTPAVTMTIFVVFKQRPPMAIMVAGAERHQKAAPKRQQIHHPRSSRGRH